MSERLTEKYSAGYELKEMNGKWCDNYCNEQSIETCNECGIYQAIQKLAEYEDLEEQGLLAVKTEAEIRNKAIEEFLKSEDYLMDKIKEEKLEVNIDYEWRKVVCVDDIRRMLHQGLNEIAEQMKGETNGLIDADILLGELKKSRKYHAENGRELELLVRCENIVKEQPTAFDVEKVVEELEEKYNSTPFQYEPNYEDGYSDGLLEAIKVVKRGGIDDGN